MHTRSPIARFVVLSLCAALVFAAPGFARAQETSVSASFAQPQKDAVQINVLVGQSRVINFDRPIGRFSVSNPEIAEAVLVAPDQVLVNGKAFGQVNFIAWEQKGSQFMVFDVFVRANLSLIDSQIRALFPKSDIRLSQANGSVVISGSVPDTKTATQVDSVIQAAGFKTVNMLQSPTQNAAQVQLQVRVAEVSRSNLREYATSYAADSETLRTNGYANSGSGPSEVGSFAPGTPVGSLSGLLSPALNLLLFNSKLNTLAMLRMLKTQGAIRALAEPNLIAMDGQQASFLAGGEFPVPIVQSSGDRVNVTIVWKEYGVRLNFKPTIIDEDHIRLELEPEVSTIDFSTGVKFDGFVIPALRTRRAKTGIELRDGQSFALAGLLDNNEMRSMSKIPLIGDIPVFGALFRSKRFEKQETELMFIVTAQMVKPVNRDDLPQMRGIDGLRNGSPLGVEPKGEGITGESGYSTGTTSTSQNATPQQPVVAPKTAQPVTPKSATPAALPSAGSGISFLPPSAFEVSWPASNVAMLQASMTPAP